MHKVFAVHSPRLPIAHTTRFRDLLVVHILPRF
jgi:hypothetical protein